MYELLNVHSPIMQILGVHLMLDGNAVDPNILSWNCKILKVGVVAVTMSSN
jgi:hypothetical protein